MDNPNSAPLESEPHEGSGDSQRTVWIGAFGKHPAWEDHIEHLGHETPFMERAKRELYLEGICALVDSGLWDGDSEEKPFLGQDWHWLWQEKSQFLVGVMWLSRDRVGREKYPMILCAHCEEFDVSWALENLLPLLVAASKKLRSLKTPEEVYDCIEETQRNCRSLSGQAISGSRPAYLDRAKGFPREPELNLLPECMARILYFISTRLGDLAIAERRGSRRSGREAELEAIRLPSLVGRPEKTLTGWMCFLRSQLDNEEPILLLQPEKERWCDILFGHLAPMSLLCLRKDLSGIPLASEIPYELDASFQQEAHATLEAIGLEWGTPSKRTIFGPVPERYLPVLPGEGTSKGSQGKRVSGKSEGESRGLATKTKQAMSDRWASIQTEPSGTGRWIFRFAAGVLLLGVAILLWSLWMADSSSTKQTEPIETVTETSGQKETEELLAIWTDYVRDHRIWFKPFVTNDSSLAFASPYLTTNLESIVSSVGLESFEPLAIYGNADTLNLTEPDPNVLRARQTVLKQGTDVRDGISSLLKDKYPQKITADLRQLQGTPLELLSRQLSSRIGQVTLSSNFVSEINRLVHLEQQATTLNKAWNDWEKLREELLNIETNVLAEMLSQEEQPLSSVTNFTRATNLLVEVSSKGLSLKEWLNQVWPRIHHSEFHKDLTNASVESISAWTNLAGQNLQLFDNETVDPRVELREELERSAIQEQMNELGEAVDGELISDSQVEDMRNRFQDLIQRFEEVEAIPAVRKNETLLTEALNGVHVEFQGLKAEVEDIWSNTFNFGRLMERHRKRAPEHRLASQLWTNYLDQVNAYIENKNQDFSPSVLQEWQSRFQAVEKFVTELANLEANHITIPPEDLNITSIGSLAGLEEELRNDYYNQLFQQNLSEELSVIKPFDVYIESPNKTRLDESAASFVHAVISIRANLAKSIQGDWAGQLEKFRTDYSVLEDAAKEFQESSRHPSVMQLQELGERFWIPEANFHEVASDFPTEEKSGAIEVAMLLALSSEVTDWPQTAPEWQQTLDLYERMLSEIRGNSALEDKNDVIGGVGNWLEQQWKKVGNGIKTLTEFLPYGQQVEASGLQIESMPSHLAYHYALAKLASSYDTAGPTLFQEDVRQFLEERSKRDGVPEIHRQILEAIAEAKRFTDWDALRRRSPNLTISPLPDEGLQLQRDETTLEFKLMDTQGIRPVYVAVSELSCDAFLDLVNESKQNLLQDPWVKTMLELKSVIKPENAGGGVVWDHPFNYFNNLTGVRQGNKLDRIVLRKKRISNAHPELEEVAILKENAGVSGNMPVNFVSPKAAMIVAKEWSCRFLTRQEWLAIQDSIPEDERINRMDAAFSKLLQEFVGALDVEPDVLNGLFYENPGSSVAAPNGAVTTDRFALFAAVDEPEFRTKGLFHWNGNVAEFLQENGQIFVAGGSFVSSGSPGVGVLPVSNLHRGYVDVGVRMVFDWAGRTVGEQIRDQLAQLRPVSP